MNEQEQNEIARLIASGFTSGRIDSDNEEEPVKSISWKLEIERF